MQNVPQRTDPYYWQAAHFRAEAARLALWGKQDELARLIYLHTTHPTRRTPEAAA